MSNWDYHSDDDASKKQNCWEQDWNDAKSVARHLRDMPIVHVSVSSLTLNSFVDMAVDILPLVVFSSLSQSIGIQCLNPYCEQLSRSITPNPDVDCNRYIKFGVLKEYIAKRFQISTLATGQ